MSSFVDETDLKTFEGWLRYQAPGTELEAMTPEQLAEWRSCYEWVRRDADPLKPVGSMRLDHATGARYAVAVEDDDGLWLALWVRCSPKQEFFVMVPRGEFASLERKKANGKPELIKWDPHTSLHSNGRLHTKSYGTPMLVTHLQPPTPAFKGSQNLAQIAGFGSRGIGAVCDPNMFTEVITVHGGVLGPRDGVITVDLVEPGHEPGDVAAWSHVDERVVYAHTIPNVMITVGTLVGQARSAPTS
jgi:hypothetical protein